MSRELAEREIFNLRKKAGEFLRAGNTDEYNRILITIATLQETHKIYSGVERKMDNAKPD